MSPEAQILDLTERNRRLQRTLESVIARAYGWEHLTAAEYFKAGQRQAWTDISRLCEAGIRWANGDAPDGPE